MKLIEKLQHKYALSEKGAKDMIKAFGACTLSNIVLMLPIALLYYLVCDLMNNNIDGKYTVFYVIGSIVCLLLIFITTYLSITQPFLQPMWRVE